MRPPYHSVAIILQLAFMSTAFGLNLGCDGVVDFLGGRDSEVSSQSDLNPAIDHDSIVAGGAEDTKTLTLPSLLIGDVMALIG